jgi:hypothetical protein
MSDITKPNLEPIEESDLNLKEKFLGGGTVKKEAVSSEVIVETPKTPEVSLERREGAVEKEEAYSKILSKVNSQKQTLTAEEDVKTDADNANSAIDAESKISNLVALAETKGIAHAVKVARHMEDNYTLDEFHDRLLGEELHLALLQKGLIKEI